ncbi:unnamed protein product [Didymodactylos carnosus]|uniref:Uncharacterized protein n=1 Tax=Didymodactylos carnosus TaxID=1234261 RepID=A0A814A8L1_9BILA|nr:unnamed protein product [Didymodactylos carnosus]CAF0931291.1 unnamed protein product [Didymodactylos carnosus]CAF3690882.1 unnamed protein product [Didymodactylos carnosus]CAF3707794.1 unnamed protein product [Didymodactylos carnosus]
MSNVTESVRINPWWGILVGISLLLCALGIFSRSCNRGRFSQSSATRWMWLDTSRRSVSPVQYNANVATISKTSMPNAQPPYAYYYSVQNDTLHPIYAPPVYSERDNNAAQITNINNQRLHPQGVLPPPPYSPLDPLQLEQK